MKKSISLLFFTVSILFIQCETISEKGEEQLLRVDYLSQYDQTDRSYFVYLPKGYDDDTTKKWPVLMFLHGDGERGNDKDELDFVMIHGPLYEAWVQKRDLPFIMIVPQLHMFGRDTIASYIGNRSRESIPVRLETGTPERPTEFDTPFIMKGADSVAVDPDFIRTDAGWDNVQDDLLHMIATTNLNYRTDTSRIYLSGLSYGGFGTWFTASKNPDIFAAINPVVGWGHPDLMEPLAKAKMPIWVFAAGRDLAVEKKYFFNGVNKLEALGHKDFRFTIHEDAGHDAWKRIYAGEDIYNWLLQHQKK